MVATRSATKRRKNVRRALQSKLLIYLRAVGAVGRWTRSFAPRGAQDDACRALLYRLYRSLQPRANSPTCLYVISDIY